MRNGRHLRRDVPVIHDLVFVKADRSELDSVIAREDTIQYRFIKGAPQGTAMTVNDTDMDHFILAVTSLSKPRYYLPDEVNPAMIGASVRLHCQGPMNGYQGNLARVRGLRKKRLILQLPGLLSATVEIPDTTLIEIIDA